MYVEGLFGSFNKCKNCGALLPDRYKYDVCPSCNDDELFHQVRDYIREHDVTEYEVAAHFKISRRKVRSWIREGRIEYKMDENKTSLFYCKACGKQISFGEYCVECLHRGGGQIYFNSKDFNK